MKDIPFKAITINDKEVIDLFLYKDSPPGLGAFTFSSLISWESIYHYQWAVLYDTLLIKLTTIDDNRGHFAKPIGDFPAALEDRIIRHAVSLNYNLNIFGISDEFVANHPGFVSNFDQAEHRELENYIYLSENLALLKGREYQSKRNLVNQFETKNNWTIEPISAGNIPDCFELINDIYTQKDFDSIPYLAYEIKALEFVLNHFARLREEGILIRVDGKPAAFSIYEYLNPSTYVVHFEKALKAYNGLYQLINRETARIILSKGFKYINREEDLGIDGLRKAKLSYHPVELYPANALVFKK